MKPAFSEGDFQLYCGDAIEVMKALPSESVDVIFADPPYFLSNGGFTVHAGRRAPVDKGLWDASRGADGDMEFHRTWIAEARRLLKPAGTIWISGTYHSIYQCGFALQLGGFHILNDIAWLKPNASPNLSCRFFTASHETLIWARKESKAKHHFEYAAMKNGDWPRDVIKKPGLQMRSVWSIATPKPSEKIHGKHPTQKPLDLLHRVLTASTKLGDIILDPFAGSSTTGIAAMRIGGRSFIGIDAERKYIDLSIKRYRDERPAQRTATTKDARTHLLPV